MRNYSNDPLTTTLLDNSSEGSSPQSSASNEEEVQELLQRASASGSVSDTKPIYNFSIPEMIRHRGSQNTSVDNSSVRRIPNSQPDVMSHRYLGVRRGRQTLPGEPVDQGAACRPRKFRRLSGRNVGRNAAFIDLTHSPEVYSTSPQRDRTYCSTDPSAGPSYATQDPDFNTWLRARTHRADCDEGTSSVADHGIDDILSSSSSQHMTRGFRAADGQPSTYAPPSVQNADRLPPTHDTGDFRESHPPVINLDDTPPLSHQFEFGVTPRMVASARQSRLHRRDIFSEVRAQIRSQLEHARQAGHEASQAIQRLNDRTLQSLESPRSAATTGNIAAGVTGQDEVQFVGEWRPRPHRHNVPSDGSPGPTYTGARRTRRLADGRVSQRLAFVHSLFPHLPSRRGISTDLFLPYMRFELGEAPPLHHFTAGMDASSMEGDYEALWRLAERLGPAKPKGLSKADIEKIPSFRFSSSCMANTNMTCVICMSEYSTCEKLRRLSCNHDFHSKCIDKWLKSNKTCPVCRDEVKT